MDIPKDLAAFLEGNNQLNYDYSRAEPNKITLCSLAELKPGVIWLSPEDENIDGYYEIPAVNLVSSCVAYDPDFILLWLPNEKVYGTWDCDHWCINIFPNTSWTDIVENPLPYLNSQWYPDNGVSRAYKPYLKYSLKEGRPF